MVFMTEDHVLLQFQILYEHREHSAQIRSDVLIFLGK